MNGEQAAQAIRQQRHFLSKVIGDLRPEHADFRPVEGMMTAAQQVRHIAMTTRWFSDGAFGPGFDMDFEAFERENHRPVPLAGAVAELDREFEALLAIVSPMSGEELEAPMAPNAILGEAPKSVLIHANGDHIAHHRGVLTVYLRLRGLRPKLIYT